MLDFVRKNRLRLSCLVFTFLCFSFAPSILAAKIDAYSKAAEMYLPSLAKLQKDELASAEKTKNDLYGQVSKTTSKGRTRIKFNLPELGNYEALKLTYQSFSSEALKDAKNEGLKPLLSDHVFEDMEIFCGGKKNVDKSLINFVDNTRTFWGKLVLQSFFTQGFKDVGSHLQEIERRQKIVKILVQDEVLFNQIDEILKGAAQDFLKATFFEKELEGFVKEQMDSDLYFSDHWFANLSSWNEKNKPLLMGFYLMSILRSFKDPLYIGVVSTISSAGLIKGFGGSRLWSVGGGLGCGLTAAMLTYFVEKLILGDAGENLRHLHDKVNGFAGVVDYMDGLAEVINQKLELKKLLPSSGSLKINSENDSAAMELSKLANELKKNTFKGEPSFFSNKGRVLACFKKIQRLHVEFVPALKALGEIDAYMSIAKLYKKYANHSNAKFCFAEFVQADAPYINIQDFWHLFLNPETAVTNSIELGSDAAGHDVILTGPNAAGKSSALKGIIDAIILAETLGIAPASSIKLTPFKRISSHLNISDDEGRESLYQAEKNRVLGLLKEVKQLGKGEFEFVIMDEMFSSTNPEEGQAAAYAIAKNLAKSPQCMCLLATHFKKLTELEKDTNGYFKNYKVYVEMLPGGKFKCPYKVIPGISNQSIAILTLQQEFDADIINEAYDVLAGIKQDTSEIIGFDENKADRLVPVS